MGTAEPTAPCHVGLFTAGGGLVNCAVDSMSQRVAVAVSASAAVGARVSAWLTSLRVGLLPTTSLPVNLCLSIAIFASLRVTGNWLLPRKKQLRQRRLLLTHVQQAVLRWEASVEDEVLHRCIGVCSEQDKRLLSGLCGDEHSASTLIDAWTGEAQTTTHDGTGPFHGIVASVVFAADFDLASYIELAYTAQQVLTSGDDPHWVERLKVIVLFGIFRRLAVAEEAREYAARWRQYVLLGAGGAGRTVATNTCAPPTSLGAWRVFGRPTWIVPLAATGDPAPAWWSSASSSSSQRGCRWYLGMPLAYFPVDAVLTCMWEETWLHPSSCSVSALPQWRRDALAALRRPHRHALRTSTHHEAMRMMTSKVYYLFVHYGYPLALEQTHRAETDARRFVADKLFHGVRVSGSSERDAVAPPLPGAGVFHSLLRRVGFTKNPHVTGNAGAFGVTLRDAPQERRVRLLTLACSVCCALGSFIDVLLPCLSTADLMCVVSLSVLSPRPGTTVSASGDGTPPSSTWMHDGDGATAAERLASQLVRHLLASVASGVVDVLISRAAASLKQALGQLLSNELEAHLSTQLHAVDDAFFSRLVAQDSASRVAVENAPTDSSEAATKQSVSQLFKCATSGGSHLVDYHCRVVRRVSRQVAMVLTALYHRQPASLLVAFIMSLDTQTLLGSLTRKFGLSTLDDHASQTLYDRGEDALPVDHPLGLQLIVEVLAEENESRHCGSGGGELTHPFLALVACSAVWQHSQTLAASESSNEQALTSLPQAKRTMALYRRVVAYRYCDGRHVRFASHGARQRVESMLLDARCILAYPIADTFAEACARVPSTPVYEESTTRPPATQAPDVQPSGGLRAPDGGPCLDETEVRLVFSQAAAQYVPSSFDYFRLFSAPTRFVLRQLGMEMVFAERTIAGLRQAAPQDASAELEELFSSASFNPLTWLLTDVVETLQSFLVVASACGVWRHRSLYVEPTDPQYVYDVFGRVERYRRIFKSQGYRSSETQQLLSLRRLQQLCECLPCTISDAAPLSQSHDVVARRHAWHAWMQTHNTSGFTPRVDAVGRIVGRFRVCHAITLQDVYFAYPQLHHYTAAAAAAVVAADDRNGTALHPGTHKPVLCGASCRFPATGMTAVIGPTGSGKSSTVSLLARHYDVLPPLCVQWSTDGSVRELWSDALLGRLMYLQAVEAALPFPPAACDNREASDPTCATTVLPRAFLGHSSSSSSSSSGHGHGVRIDGIPVACFSLPYLRQWTAHLEQSPHIYEKLSLFDNVRMLRPADVTYADAAQVATMCRCAAFIKDKPQQLLHRTGTLSGGEQQRLALARVVAAIRARIRAEAFDQLDYLQDLLQGIHSGDGDDADGGDAASSTAAEEEDVALHPSDGVLLLDEPTSRLDAYNELQILETLDKLCTGSWGGVRLLAIAIAHRLSTLRAAKHVVVVESGRVTAEGAPSAVVIHNAFAKEQWRLQELS